MNTIRVHARSGIEGWSGWPGDVVDTLRFWNRHSLLTFARLLPHRIFQCEGCHDWHEPARNGVAVYGGKAYCDGCLVVIARASEDAA